MQRTLNSDGKKTFLRNKIIWYAFYSKFNAFNDFEKIEACFEKPIYFFQKNSYFLRSLTISVAFYSNFAAFWWWIVFKDRTVDHRTLSHQTLSKHWQITVNKNVRVDWLIFFPYHIWVENNQFFWKYIWKFISVNLQKLWLRFTRSIKTDTKFFNGISIGKKTWSLDNLFNFCCFRNILPLHLKFFNLNLA